MANGLQGLTVEVVGIQLLPPQFGYQGLTVEKVTGQYFAPLFGIVGITVNESPDLPIPLKKTIKHF